MQTEVISEGKIQEKRGISSAVTEKYRGSDYVDRSHRGCDCDKAVDPERAV